MLSRNLVILMLLSSSLAVYASQGSRTHDIQPQDYFTLARIGDCSFSPDGRLIAYTEARWDSSLNRRNTDLWLVEISDKSVRRLTFGPADDGAPSWSPDSKYLYFGRHSPHSPTGQANEPGKQVWRIMVDGSNLQQITTAVSGIDLFELSPDGATLYYTMKQPEYAGTWPKLYHRFPELEYGAGATPFSQLRELDLHTWRDRKLVDNQRVVVDLAVAPDGENIALITRPDNTLLSNEGWSRVELYELPSGKLSILTPEGWREQHPSPYGWLSALCWSKDSQTLAFTIGFDGYPLKIYTARVQGDAVALHQLDLPPDITVQSNGMQWHDNGELRFLAQKQARRRVYSLINVRQGKFDALRELTPGDVVVDDFTSADDQLAIIKSSTSGTPDIFLASERGAYARITNVNPQVKSWKLPQISIVSWIGANGDSVAGILELPAGHDGQTPLPCILHIHGGPTAASLYRFELSTGGRGLYAAQGYAVFSPNYRGSTGYGADFMTDLIGRENDIEVEDILTGVQAMVERGFADGERLGVIGWSNGGFLTNCLLTRTDRFKAASSGAGVIDQVMQWGLEDTPGHVINFMQGLPWQQAEAYRAASPLYDLGKVSTPTLLHVGGADERVPAAHARTLYRALKHYRKIETELVIYPGEPHGLKKYRRRQAKMAWDQAWFARYLLGETDEMSLLRE